MFASVSDRQKPTNNKNRVDFAHKCQYERAKLSNYKS